MASLGAVAAVVNELGGQKDTLAPSLGAAASNVHVHGAAAADVNELGGQETGRAAASLGAAAAGVNEDGDVHEVFPGNCCGPRLGTSVGDALASHPVDALFGQVVQTLMG